MKKLSLFIAALAGTVLVSCSSDDFVAETPQVATPEQPQPIVFNSTRGAVTRANTIGGAAAADLLNGRFVVSGYKGSATATVGSTVYDNYNVIWTANTAHTTQSNSSNWDYVGKERIKHAITNGVTSQTIKYWDYSQPQYDFIAWSTGKKTAIFEGTPADGQVLVSAITPSTATGEDGVAYSFQGKAADLEKCYIADLVTVKKADGGYGQPVTLTFRALGSKVRIGIYETIPGYSVKDVQFYSAAASDDAGTTPRIFTTTANNIYTEGKYTVYYPTVDDASKADNNQAHVRFAGTGTQSTIVNFGNLNYTIAEEGEKTEGKKFLGRTSATASFAGEAEGNYFTQYLPNESGTNLNLRVNYTLESIDGSGETINVKGATAQVPSIYTQWKSGFAYTYIFKISDKTNGHTGVYDPTKPDDTTVNSDPAGLYPITFDACVVDDEDNDATQETITLISTPSITTYQQGSTVINANEYAATGDIFVTVNDGNTGSTPDLANGQVVKLTGKAALYSIPEGKTEAEVIDALQMQDDNAATGTIKGRSGLVLTNQPLQLTGRVNYGVDNNPIIVGGDKVAKFTPTAATTYAFVYTKTASTSEDVKYQALAFDQFAVGQTKYRYDYKAATTTDAQKGVLYYTESAGVYTKKTPFIGQGVSNLYLDNAGNTIAKGYAVTGTAYYYTTDNGMSYKQAHNVDYADFATATLYTFDGTNYTAKNVATPEDGVAYYFKETDDSYTYCVILPQQTTGWFEIDNTKYVVANEAAAVEGQTYFDKYTQNNGVYYTKVIKVQ